MGIRINQNVMAMNAYRNLTSSEGSLSKSLEKLSSGFRINRAADDASGLVISEGLRAQVTGLKMAIRNAQDGVSVVQTAEGALTEVSSLLQRVRELAVQAASTGASDTAARNANQSEVVELLAEVNRIAATTKFGGSNLLDGSYGVTHTIVTGNPAAGAIATGASPLDTQFNINVGNGARLVQLTGSQTYPASIAGANALKTELQNKITAALSAAGDDWTKVAVDVKYNAGSNKLVTTIVGTQPATTVTLTNVGTAGNEFLDNLGIATGATSTSSGVGGLFQVGAGVGEVINVTIAATDATTLGLAGLDVSVNPNVALTAVDAAVTAVSTIRGDLGAKQNRLERTISNLQVTTENLAASESRIRDTDMAAEMMAFTRAQILQQAGTAMLAQANAVPQTVLQLLQQR